jgi:hypothetical protein
MEEKPKRAFWRLHVLAISVLALSVASVALADLFLAGFKENLASASPAEIALIVAIECVPIVFATFTTEFLVRRLVRVHLSTMLGLLILIGFLMHLNLSPTTVWVQGVYYDKFAEIHFGWPFFWGTQHKANLLIIVLDIIVSMLILAGYVFAYEHWIRWSTKAGSEASKKVSQAAANLSRLRDAKEQSTKPGEVREP